MKKEEIVKQFITIGLSLSIKEIDYNKAIEMTKATLKEYEKLIVMQSSLKLEEKYKTVIDDLHRELFDLNIDEDYRLRDYARWSKRTGIIEGKLSILENL